MPARIKSPNLQHQCIENIHRGAMYKTRLFYFFIWNKENVGGIIILILTVKWIFASI